MTNLQSAFNLYLKKQEKDLLVNRNLRRSMQQKLFPKVRRLFFVPFFAAAVVVVLAIFVVRQLPVVPQGSDILALNNSLGGEDPEIVSSSGSEVPSFDIANFTCKQNCQGIVVPGNPGKPLFADSACPICNEVRLFANLTGEHDAIVLSGEAFVNGDFINLPEQTILLAEHPNWQTEAFSLTIAQTGTVFDVGLSETGEWDLIKTVVCSTNCEHLKVGVPRGQVGAVLLIDTCVPKPCQMYQVMVNWTHANDPDQEWLKNSKYSGNRWIGRGGSYASFWTVPSLFAFNDDHGEEVPGSRVEFSAEETDSEQPLHYDQIVDGHEFSFDVVTPTIPTSNGCQDSVVNCPENPR